MEASRLFALIIGIDNYQDSNNIRRLKGCVNDSTNVYKFLTETLRADPLHIKHLRNKEATRERILSAFEEHLIGNDEIKPQDPILFYFAGHGSYEQAPVGWHTANNMMETICPYDERARTVSARVRGIPDRTYDSLMRKLASIKGDNITAIIDSCHSGGMGRDSDSENARFLPPPDSPFPKGLDNEIWKWNEDNLNSRLPTTVLDVHLPYPSRKSHVLLAACLAEEVAFETASQDGHYSGAFTTLLLTVLKRCNPAETTYLHLFDILLHPKNKLPKQTPFVDGVNKTRILFSTTDFGRNTFSVSLKNDGTLSVAAGSFHRVDLETEFAITSGKDRFKLKPHTVSSFTCSFLRPSNTLLAADLRAEVIKWNRPHRQVFSSQLTSLSTLSELVNQRELTDVTFSLLSNGTIQVERRDPLLILYAKRFISIPPGVTSAIFEAISRFNFYLYLQSESHPVGNRFRMKLERIAVIGNLMENWPRIYGPATPYFDFFTSGERLRVPDLSIVTGSAKITDFVTPFCLTLRSEFGIPLYPYVFLFDPATYEIACFYHPDDGVAPLQGERIIPVGYGNQGGDPFKFRKDEVTFFKIFVTSKYVDMSSLPQASLFSEHSASRLPSREPIDRGEFWGSWIYVVGD
ncbi:hypothetical protein BYT27DRAFT_7231665 [Phlegmacium glaucopus]|nr:hypothetical protein BYT27DRAFT_7231665 [Phlegmacium glaucopus]